ncbi:MAG: prepilin-type N-terminal cleavage/methylation domain-containing protein [Robiginitomaculum sp.]|nr:prepilin-type N-terminal cleavage/methylation domain-containing protein [Robiginitomaculum sp.]
MAKTAITFLEADNKKQSGYTLMELVVVMVIIALATAVIAPRLITNSPARSVKNSSVQLTALYKKGRIKALQTGVSQVVLLNTTTKTAWLSDVEKIKLPANIDINTITAEPESGNNLAGIRFFPDGTSTGGEITIASANTAYVISVIWANSEVRLETVK